MESADNQGLDFDVTPQKSNSDIVEKLMQNTSIQATQLSNLERAFNGSADYIELYEDRFQELERNHLSACSQDDRPILHNEFDIASIRLNELDLRKRLEDAEQSLYAKNCIINDLLRDLSCRDRQSKLSEKRALEVGREMQKMKAVLDSSQHALRLSQKSSNFASVNSKTITAQKSEILALRAYLTSYQKRLDTSQKTERAMASRLEVLEDQIDARQPFSNQSDVQVKVLVVTEKKRKIRSDLPLMNAEEANASPAVGTKFDCGLDFEASFHTDDSFEKGTSHIVSKYNQGYPVEAIRLYGEKGLDSTNEACADSIKRLDKAEQNGKNFFEEFSVRLKTVERERDVLLEFIKDDMEKSTDLNAKLKKAKKCILILESELIIERRSKISSAERQSKKRDNALNNRDFHVHGTLPNDTCLSCGSILYSYEPLPSTVKCKSPQKSSNESLNYTDGNTERTELINDKGSLSNLEMALAELASDLKKIEQIDLRVHYSHFHLPSAQKILSDNDQAVRSYSHNYLRTLKKKNPAIISYSTANLNVPKNFTERSGPGLGLRFHSPVTPPLPLPVFTPDTSTTMDPGSVTSLFSHHRSWVNLPSLSRISKPLHAKLKNLLEDLRVKEEKCLELESELSSVVEEKHLSYIQLQKNKINFIEALQSCERKYEELKKKSDRDIHTCQLRGKSSKDVVEEIITILGNVPGGWDQFFDKNILEYYSFPDRTMTSLNSLSASHDNPEGSNSWARSLDLECTDSPPVCSMFRNSAPYSTVDHKPEWTGGGISTSAKSPLSRRYSCDNTESAAYKTGDVRTMLTPRVIDRAVAMVGAISAELRDKQLQLFTALADLRTAHTDLATSKANSGIVTSRINSLQMRDINRVEAFEHIESNLHDQLTHARDVSHERDLEVAELKHKLQELTRIQKISSMVDFRQEKCEKEKQSLHGVSQMTGSRSSADSLMPHAHAKSQSYSTSTAINHSVLMKSNQLQNRMKDFNPLGGSVKDSSPTSPGPPPKLTHRTPSKEISKGPSIEMWEDDSCETPDTEYSSPDSGSLQDTDDDSIEGFPDYNTESVCRADSKLLRDSRESPTNIDISPSASPLLRSSFSRGLDPPRSSSSSSSGSFDLPRLTGHQMSAKMTEYNLAAPESANRDQRYEMNLKLQHSTHSLSTSDPVDATDITSTQRSCSNSNNCRINSIYSDAAVSNMRLESASPSRQFDALLRKTKMTFAALRKEIEIESNP